MHLSALKAAPLPPQASKADIDIAIAHRWEADNKLEEALTVANGVLDEDPDNAMALLIAGRVAIKMQKHGLAYNLLRRALELVPSRWDIRTNLAAAAIGMQRLDDAKRLLQDVRRIRPSDEKSLGLLCLLAVYDCNPRLAIDLGEKSLSIKPNQWDVHESLGYAHLMLGDWVEGWKGYEAFIGHSKYRPLKPPHDDCPYWDGSKNLNLYIRGEQGIGDELSFASVLPEVIAEQKSITFDCDEKLGGLFRRSFPTVEIHATRKGKTAEKEWLAGRKFDAHCLIGSLAFHKRRADSDFPGTAYLVADPERRTQWRALLDTLPGKKVGIAWTGGTKGTFRERRSLTLEKLLPILRREGVSWISLQYQDPSDEIEAFEETHGIQVKHWARCTESQDYDDTAALVAELDLVITVPTAVAHLCGALGKECWVIAPSKPNWFWNLPNNRMPWHSSLTLHKQTETWPFEEVAQKLREFL